MSAFVVAIRAVPVEPPAAANRTQPNGRWIPGLQAPRHVEVGVPQLLVARRIRMHVVVRASPNVDLVVHVVKMGRRAKGCGKSSRPLLSIHTRSLRFRWARG